MGLPPKNQLGAPIRHAPANAAEQARARVTKHREFQYLLFGRHWHLLLDPSRAATCTRFCALRQDSAAGLVGESPAMLPMTKLMMERPQSLSADLALRPLMSALGDALAAQEEGLDPERLSRT